MKKPLPPHLVQLHESECYQPIIDDLIRNYPVLPEYKWGEGDKTEYYKQISGMREGFRLVCRTLGINIQEIIDARRKP